MFFLLASFISSGAGALTINDTYWGGIAYGVSNSDVIGFTVDFGVTSLTASPQGTNIQVVLSGPYFGSIYADNSQSGLGDPGDLYISSGGWKVNSPANNATLDTFDQTEGWDYVIAWNRNGGLPTDGTPVTAYVYSLDNWGSTILLRTWGENNWNGYRTDQAYLGGHTASSLGTGTVALSKSGETLTFTFPATIGAIPLDLNSIGYHWTMACGNDVVEGGGTPIPEPATMLLLGSGLIGLAGFARRKFKK